MAGEALPQEESLSREDNVPVEETLEETLTGLIEEAEEDAAALEELTQEADDGIVDQTLEELLAPEQPDDDDFSGQDVVHEEETATVEQEGAEPEEGRLSEVETRPEDTAETEEEGEKIVDQPLAELLADEQPEEVSGSEDYFVDIPTREGERPEEEKEPATDEEFAVSSVTAEKPTRKSLFQRLQERLGKTRQGLLYRLDSIFLGKKEIDEDLLDELEEILITSDLGVATTMDLLDAARRQVKRKDLSDPQALKKILRDKILDYLLASDQPAELVMPESGPFVIMVVGVNGVGKTTTIGKIANKFKESGQSVLLIAADTFRAAAIDQLKIWAGRVGTEIIAHKPGADPSSVVFDGLEYGVRNDFDAIIIDTAGRLHTSVNLMEELKKIKRVIGKKMVGAPHEVLLVLDATTGQNGISQAKLFGEAVGVSGLALTKLDGTAKGGIVANVCRELKIPVRFIGIGEQMDDLRDFDAHEFVDALFAEETGAGESSATG
ncbi:MAG TPA: signal recognition particle-docking protein FtsY [Desulfobulbaceae bacterium]|nr:signal recognition particle-docking protein FtsY [Desulfobulbaceae bacterium]